MVNTEEIMNAEVLQHMPKKRGRKPTKTTEERAAQKKQHKDVVYSTILTQWVDEYAEWIQATSFGEGVRRGLMRLRMLYLLVKLAPNAQIAVWNPDDNDRVMYKNRLDATLN